MGKHIQISALKGKAKTKCPFHEEATPSMVIDFGSGTFHCLGCQAKGKIDGGDVFPNT